jgi:hypothetical protein
MKRKWIKDYCPYAKNQGFYSVVGNVDKGQKVFGFEHTQSAGSDTITFASATRNIVTQMQDTSYEVILSDTSSGSVVTICSVLSKTKTSFALVGESSAVYDVVVIGNVNY